MPEPLEIPDEAPRPKHRHLRTVPHAPHTEKLPKKKRLARAPKTTGEDFFESSTVRSQVKSRIVAGAFSAWAHIMKSRTREHKLAYIDFYAGKGRYEDGTASTPILIFEIVLKDHTLPGQFMAMLGDEDAACVDALKKNVAALPSIDKLKYEPKIAVQSAVDSEFERYFTTKSIIPTFMFLDPFGYKGVTVNLIHAVLKDWGCDVVFFFCFNRMHGALRNSKVRPHMDELFGKERVDELRALLPTLKSPGDKEAAIIAALESSLASIGGTFVHTFRFRDEHGKATHHLVHVTKSMTPHTIVKAIMAKESSGQIEDVANFEFQENYQEEFVYGSPIDDLADNLLVKFRGKTLSIQEIFDKHHYKTPYIKRNYQEALRRLCHDRKAVTADRLDLKPKLKAERRDMPFDHTVITFPA